MALQDFITHVKQVGMLVGNKFEFIAPSIDGASPTAANTVSLLCSSSNLPGLTLMTNDIRHYGEPIERPTSIIYPSISLTFYLDNDLSAKRYFEQWINLVFNRETRAINYYDLYTRDVEIVVYDKSEQEVERIKLFECYPKSIQDVNLDYHNNAVSVVNVNLIYKWWSSIQTENWRGNSNQGNKPLDEYSTIGRDNLDFENETMGNFTGNTIYGDGNPNSPFGIENPDDISGFLQSLGNDISSGGIRRLMSAREYLNFSNLDPQLIEQFQNSYDILSQDFSNLGSNITRVGMNVDPIGPIISDVSNSVNRVAINTTSFNGLMNQIGPTHDLGQFTGNMIQMSNSMSNITNINQMPQYLNSLSSNFNQIGSMINQSNNSYNNINSATTKSLNAVSQTYFETGSFLNKAATSIGR